MDIKTALGVIKSTIENIEIKANRDNCDKMLGVHILIDKLIDAVDQARIAVEGETNDYQNQQEENV